MMNVNTEKVSSGKIKSGFLWSFLENVSLQGIRFLIGIIMARLLTPADYGMVGMLTVFIALSDLLINSGFNAALIKTQERTEKDYSTVFYFNVTIGLLLYGLLYFSSPFIANFYNTPLLEDLTKFVALSLIFNSLCIVPTAKLQIALRFRTISFISILSAIFQGISGLYFAYHDWGVWALVYSTIIGNAVRMLLLYLVVRWTPITFFYFSSFKRMFSYGFKLMMGIFIDALYTNIYPLVIGRVYSTDALGYYSRAQGYSNLPSSTLTMMIYKVCFPVFCKQNNNFPELLESYKKMMRNVSLIVFPIMLLIVAMSKPLIIVLISSKWLPCVPYLQALCFATMWYPILEVNLSVIKALGRSGLVLKMQIINKIFALMILMVTLRYDVIIMCWGAVVISLFSVAVNFYFSVKVLGLSMCKQFNLIAKPFIGSVIMMLVVYFLCNYIQSLIFECIAGFICGIFIYVFSLHLMGIPVLKQLNRIVKR